MPWSNQGGSGGGGGGWKGGGPWGQGPTNGGGQQPDLEEIFKRSQDKLKRALPGGGMNRGFMVLLALAALVVGAFFGFTVRVNPEQLGVVTRFGKLDRQLTPGLNFRLPYPLEEVYLPEVTRQNRTNIGYRADQRNTSSASELADEGLILTGDENIVNVNFTVLWRINDASKFLFNVRDGVEFLDGNEAQTVKDVAESSMREVVGKSDIQPIMTGERLRIETDVRELMQRTLDRYGAGILVEQVQMQKVEAPPEVRDAFLDVQSARADLERVQNEAQTYLNKVVPEARGDALRILQEAQGYKEKMIADAKGQTDRFKSVYEEYKKAPDVTRRRMYLETMERVLGSMDKIIVDQKGQGVVPFLPLNTLTGRPATGGQ